MVKDINPGTGWSSPAGLTNVNGTLFFVASDGTTKGSGLWKSDGTAAGTVLVENVSAGNLTNVNGTLFFAGNDGSHGTELWKSDGTTNGTKMVKDIYSGSTSYHGNFYGHYHFKIQNSSNPSGLVNVNGTLFFTANDGTHGPELWKSDGSSNGTVQVADIDPGSAGSFPRSLTNVNGTLFFSANNGVSGYELWKSDGTATGTVLVKDIDPAVASSNPGNLTNPTGTPSFTPHAPTNA